MRKFLLLLVFICTSHFIASAQSGFFNETVHYYEFFYQSIWPVKIDSLNAHNGDTTLYFNSGMISYNGFDCLDTAGTNIIGPKTTKRSTGNYLFYNRYGDSIPIYMDRDEGEEWICYTDSIITVNATVESISSASFNGNNDIIHTIRFSIESDAPEIMYQTIDNNFIKIGEKSGVIRTLAWVIFPYRIPELLSPYNRFSKEEFIDGAYPSFEEITNVSQAEINDFHVGDEFHIEYSYWDETPYITDRKLLKYQTIDRIENADKVIIKFIREKQIGVDSAAYDDEENGTMYYLYGDVAVDTITSEYSKSYFIFSKPMFYNPNGTNILTIKHEKPAYMPFSLPVWASPGDSCGFYDDLLHIDEYYYIKGLGGPYYQRMEYEYHMINDKKTLKYYSLADGSTYGEPIHFLDIESVHQQANLHVYPIPAEQTLNVKLKNHLADSYKIHDITGRLVQEGSIAANQELMAINIASLSKGIYLIVIQQDGRPIDKKRIIKK
ncbi:MAG: T9SS type A sorting domain-containing protein [Salinivirgaceae bacterium]|jgi:hypothetical protein|nr:T9SS type A sorting domain-containing protein [Salinivirgaceae bacterium]